MRTTRIHGATALAGGGLVAAMLAVVILRDAGPEVGRIVSSEPTDVVAELVAPRAQTQITAPTRSGPQRHSERMDVVPMLQSRGIAASDAAGIAPPMPPREIVGAVERPNTFDARDMDGWQIAAEKPVSTFGLESDAASWPYIRSQLERGQWPDAGGVRIEEMLAYFDFSWPVPEPGGDALAASIQVIAAPWSDQSEIVRIGIAAEVGQHSVRPTVNATFLIDSSGSMNTADKLGVVLAGVRMFVEAMQPDDTIAIVTYAGDARVVLEPTSGIDKSRILEALESITAGGGTAGAKGIETAYELAAKSFASDRINRVLIATDGDFNVGTSSLDGLESLISEKRQTGIFLSVLGVGTSGYNDAIAQRLAQKGNGTAYFLDSVTEARRVLVQNLDTTLSVVAVDAKAQVEWNPAVVAEYRLLGFETRALRRQDFNDDSVDAGEIGEGHSVTVLYEITRPGQGRRVDPLRYGTTAPAMNSGRETNELGFVKLRYKRPGEDDSRLIEVPIGATERADGEAAQESRFAAAVAAAGMILKGEDIGMTLGEVARFARLHAGQDDSGRRRAFADLLDIAASLR